MKACPACQKEYPETVRFCPDCGVKLVTKSRDQQASTAGVSVQDGVVTGGIHVTSTDNRTFISREDDAHEVLTCARCGAHLLKPDGFTCPACGRFFCLGDYDKQRKSCRECAEMGASAAARQYRALLEEVMQDGRVDPAERAQLDKARIALGLSAETCAQLESERRAAGAVGAARLLGRRDQALLEEARNLLFHALSFEEALRIVESLYERFGENPEIRRTYLLALVEAAPDHATEVIANMRFDDLDKSLAHIELLSRRGDFDHAHDLLKLAQHAFGPDCPDLIACEVDLTLEECRRTGAKALWNIAAESSERLDASSSEYAAFAHAFLRYVEGDKRALDNLDQAGNFYARRKKRFIAGQLKARSTAKVGRAMEAHVSEERPQVDVPPMPPSEPQPPPLPALMPGMWQLTLVSPWGQTFHGTCQVNVNGANVMLVAEVSGHALLWDGLMHFFQERSIFRGALAGTDLIATCGEAVRMVDGMAVPVPGLPIRFNAAVGNDGRSISGMVVNSMGEAARVFLKI